MAVSPAKSTEDEFVVITIRVEEDMRASIQAIADELYEGNRSMVMRAALRKFIVSHQALTLGAA